MTSVKYIGLDVHKESISICVRNSVGKVVMHKSWVTPSHLPSGAYYLFIGDRDTGHSLLNTVQVIADPESGKRPGVSTQEYLSAHK